MIKGQHSEEEEEQEKELDQELEQELEQEVGQEIKQGQLQDQEQEKQQQQEPGGVRKQPGRVEGPRSAEMFPEELEGFNVVLKEDSSGGEGGPPCGNNSVIARNAFQ